MANAKEPGKFQWYAIKLGIVILIVFMLQNIFPSSFGSFVLVSSQVLQQPWSLVTYIFLHANGNHLVSNLFPLSLFGLILERIIGSRRFLIIFFTAGIMAGIISTFFYSSVIGASGAIFSIMGVLVGIRPKMTVLAFGVPIPMIAAVALWVMLDFAGVLIPTSIANVGHLAGLSAGVVFGMWLRPKYKLPKKKKEDKVELDEEYFRKWEEKYITKKESERSR
jgi:membrane associated rhomboid family serine protease